MISENKSCNPSLAMTSCHRFQCALSKPSSISLSVKRLRKPGLDCAHSQPGFLVHAIIERRLKTLNNASALATSNAGFLASVSSPEGVVRAPTSGRGFKWNSQIGQTLTRQVQQMYAKGPQVSLSARGLLYFS